MLEIKIHCGGSYGDWFAMEKDGDVDYDWDGDGWRYCGSPRGSGSTIADAIDELIEALEIRDGVDITNYKWC